ncbi:MAG: chemotaxis protein, partial [Magnetospirillum sp.]
MAESIDRAVHELVANALVHGNLDVASPGPGMEGFDAYCKALDAALADPRRLGHRVEISAARTENSVEVAVLDQGAGYDFCE